jgi:cation:H+ antiporter
MAIGNAVGSVVFNAGVILGIALMCQPFKIERKDYAFKGILVVAIMALMLLFSFQGVDLNNLSFESQGVFGYIGSAILLILFVVFIVENVISAKKNALESAKLSSLEDGEEDEKVPTDKKSIITNILKLVLGAAAIAVGAILLKDNAVELARIALIPEAVIGVTILAIGTSLPELVTMIIAVKKGQASLSVGNIIGANTIDLSLILPLSAFIAGGNGVPVASAHLLVTMPVTLVILAISIIPTLIFKKFSRWQGITIFAIYLAYFVYNIVSVVA